MERTVIEVPFHVLPPHEVGSNGPLLELDDMVGEVFTFWTPIAKIVIGAFALIVVAVVVGFHYFPPKPSGFNWRGAAIASCYYGMVVCGISATALSVKLGRMIQRDRRAARQRQWNELFSTNYRKEVHS